MIDYVSQFCVGLMIWNAYLCSKLDAGLANLKVKETPGVVQTIPILDNP